MFGDPRLPDRIWNKVIPVPWSGCWLWLGETDSWGYGRVWWNGRKHMAHRVVYKVLKGRIYRTLDHRCVCANCVNPDHLRDVTQRKNNMLAIYRRQLHQEKYGINA